MSSVLDRLDALPADRRRFVFAAAAVLGTVMALAFFDAFGAPGDLATMQPTRWDPEADDLKAGIDLEQSDPDAAIALFHEILRVMPKHLDATQELARTLDQTGRRAEARPYWEDVVRTADYYAYKPIAAAARKRLEEVP